jgi:hypothetical protein
LLRPRRAFLGQSGLLLSGRDALAAEAGAGGNDVRILI